MIGTMNGPNDKLIQGKQQLAEKRRQSEYGNQTNWPRGQLLPDRLPDLSAMFGASQ